MLCTYYILSYFCLGELFLCGFAFTVLIVLFSIFLVSSHCKVPLVFPVAFDFLVDNAEDEYLSSGVACDFALFLPPLDHSFLIEGICHRHRLYRNYLKTIHRQRFFSPSSKQLLQCVVLYFLCKRCIQGPATDHTCTSSLLGGAKPKGTKDTPSQKPSVEEVLQARQKVQAWSSSEWLRIRITACQPSPAFRGALSQGGNTCYLASLLQCFFHAPSFQTWMLQRSCLCNRSSCPSCLLATTARNTTDSGSVYSLNPWNELIALLLGESGAQRDIGDFLKAFLTSWQECTAIESHRDCLHFLEQFRLQEELSIRKTPQCQCFGGDIMHSSKITPIHFLDLGFASTGAPISLQQLLHEYLQPQKVDMGSDSVEDRWKWKGWQ